MRQLWQTLLSDYDEHEARAVVSWLLDVCFHLSQTDIVCGALERMQEDERARLQAMMARLQQGEPVQYVAETADFGPRQFHVTPDVLIPRPETYELCQWIVENEGHDTQTPLSLLDVGTGSGCIATTLALDLPASQVTAWDISAEALHIARINAQRHGAQVLLELHDALTPPSDHARWHLIVSNPPYVCQQEKADMARHVLHYEPSLALFVPDSDPLLFYRAIGHYALTALHPAGHLYFELNAAYASATATMLRQQGFTDVTLKADQYGRTRFLRAKVK